MESYISDDVATAACKALSVAATGPGSRVVLRPVQTGRGWRGHHHLVVECFLQLAGSTTLITPDRRYRIQAGQLALVPPGLPHDEHPGRRFANIVCKCQHGRIRYHRRHRDGGAQDRFDHRIVPFARADAVAAQLQEALIRPIDDPIHQHLLAASLHELREALLHRDQQALGDDVVERCRYLIAEYGCQPEVDVRWLAAHCGLHPDHLTRRCRRAVGVGVNRWLLDHRLEEAAHALRTSERSLATIRSQVGITDPTWFARVFRRRYGLAPSRWRREQQGPDTKPDRSLTEQVGRKLHFPPTC